MRKPSVLLSGFGILLICACTPAHYVADRGRHLIVGMDAATLKSCAGIPTRTDRLGPRTELYSYEIKYEYTNGAQVTLPIIGGGFNLGLVVPIVTPSSVSSTARSWRSTIPATTTT